MQSWNSLSSCPPAKEHIFSIALPVGQFGTHQCSPALNIFFLPCPTCLLRSHHEPLATEPTSNHQPPPLSHQQPTAFGTTAIPHSSTPPATHVPPSGMGRASPHIVHGTGMEMCWTFCNKIGCVRLHTTYRTGIMICHFATLVWGETGCLLLFRSGMQLCRPPARYHPHLFCPTGQGQGIPA